MPVPAPAAGPPRVRGEVVYLYAFDVGNEVRLADVPGQLAGRPVPFVLRADRVAPRDVPFTRPLTFESTADVRLGGRPVRVFVRVYDVGVVSVTARVAVEAAGLDELRPFHAPALDDGRPLDALAREVCDAAARGLGPALVRPGPPTAPEAYTVFALADLGGPADAPGWLAAHRRAVAGLLTETPPDRLSDAQVDEVVRLSRSFEVTDLVVVDWDAALVVDLGGAAEDVLFVLELANLQLEEFRWLDRALDAHLDRAYADLRRRGWFPFGAAARVLGSLRRLRVDHTRLADEVTHATKFVGDWHLARVYLLARERFHLDQWRASVEGRLGQLDQLYTLVRGELFDRRMLWLEVIIVVFFAVDLLLLLRKP